MIKAEDGKEERRMRKETTGERTEDEKMRGNKTREKEEDESMGVKWRGEGGRIRRRRGEVTHISTSHVCPASEMEMRETHTGLITFIPTEGLGWD